MGDPSQATTWGRALWALLLATLGSAASQPLGAESVCTARPLAKYSLTFTGKWSQTAFPKQYPLFRPPAQWSSLLGKRSPRRPFLPVQQRPPSWRGRSHDGCTTLLSWGGGALPSQCLQRRADCWTAGPWGGRQGGRPEWPLRGAPVARRRLTPPDARAGAAHSSDYSMWRKNQYVSDGLRDFAERGEAWALMRELEAAGEKLQSVHEVFSAPAVPSGTGHTSAELEAHARHSLVSRRPRGGGEGLAERPPRPPGWPSWSREAGAGLRGGGSLSARPVPSTPPLQVSFVVRIVPSPDWFVGVDSLDLCDGDRWREQVEVDLYPYDAGTDSGFTFSSPNFATIPQDTVTEVRR